MVPITTTTATYHCSYAGVMEIYFSVVYVVCNPKRAQFPIRLFYLNAGVLLAMSTSLALP